MTRYGEYFNGKRRLEKNKALDRIRPSFRDDGYGDPDLLMPNVIRCLECGWCGDASAWIIHARIDGHILHQITPVKNIYAVYGLGEDRRVWSSVSSVDIGKNKSHNRGIVAWCGHHWRLLLWLAIILLWMGLAIAVFRLVTAPLGQYIDIRQHFFGASG
jgi:hypothetical protein